MKVLVLGAGGMLGHKIFEVFSKKNPDVYGTLHRSQSFYKQFALGQSSKLIDNLDAANRNELFSVLDSLWPDVVVNCIGVTTRKINNGSLTPVVQMNSLLPHVLADWIAAHKGTRLIHFSTDCVFSGLKGDYHETDPVDAGDAYGLSKALGEIHGRSGALTLRSSIIGWELAGKTELVEWFHSQQGKKIKGFSRVIYTGVTTQVMAAVVMEIIEQQPRLEGLYHLASSKISKFDLLSSLNQALGFNVEIEDDPQKVSDKSLDGSHFLRATGIRIPSWSKMIEDLAREYRNYYGKGEPYAA